MRARTKIEMPTGVKLADNMSVYADRAVREGDARVFVVKATRVDHHTIEVELEIEADVFAEFHAKNASPRYPSAGLRIGIVDGRETQRMFPEDQQR